MDSMLSDTMLGNECPHCHTQLKIEVTRKMTFKEQAYFTVITACGGFQVLRHIMIRCTAKVGKPIKYSHCEVMQRWIAPDGKYVTFARLRQGWERVYYDAWLFDTSLELRRENPIYNRVYYGEMYIQGNVYKHIYEPLVSKELFDRVQKLFTQNGNHNRNNTTEYAKTPYIFRKMIHCKECGCLITPETKIKKNGKQYIYLRCGHPNKTCHQGIVNENIILEQLKTELLDRITLPPTLQKVLKNQLIKDLDDTSAFNKIMKTNISNKLTELKVKEDKALDFYLEGKLSQEIYEAKQEQISKERQELEITAEKYKTINSEIKQKIIDVMSMASNVSFIFAKANPTQKQKLLKSLITDCKINGSVLEYKLLKPFDKLLGCSDYKSWSAIITEHLNEFEEIKI